MDRGYDETVSLIYDAALDGALWPDAVVAISTLLDSHQPVLHLYGARGGLPCGIAPQTDPVFKKAYLRDWSHTGFIDWTRVSRPKAGMPIMRETVIGDEVLLPSGVYNEWWRPQGMGRHALGAHVVAEREDCTVLAVYGRRSREQYSRSDIALFSSLATHVARALEVHRRLRLTDLARQPFDGVLSADLLVVDGKGRVLHANPEACERLHRAGLLVPDGRLGTVRSPGLAIEKLVRNAAGSGDAFGGDRYEHPLADGSALRITVIPCRERPGAANKWLEIDRPSALLVLGSPRDDKAAKVERFASRHGLTQAEAAVAIEIARGDGRAAAGARLGIRETTVRSHLSAIFDKLDIHRQAELARLVADR